MATNLVSFEDFFGGGASGFPAPKFAASPDLLARVEHQESRGNPSAVSPKGARGVMQIMPGTMVDPGFGVKPLNPNAPDPVAENRRMGRDYLNAMLDRYEGDEEAALVAYNWGPGNADKWIAGGRDPRKLPGETRDYLKNILGGRPSGVLRGVDIDTNGPKFGAVGAPMVSFEDFMGKPKNAGEGLSDEPSGGVTVVPKGGSPRNLQASSAPDTSIQDALIYGASQGLGFGLADELGARFETELNGGDYDQNLAEYRRVMEAAQEKHPWLFLAGELLGGIPSGAGLVKSGLSLTANAARSGAPFLKRAGAAALEGAGLGAVYGFGTGEGGVSERGKSAAAGAAAGAVAGPVLEGVATAGGRVLRRMPDPNAQAAVDQAAQFDIPLTRGQATGDVTQQAYEQAALHDAKGITAGRIMRSAEDRQQQAVEAAKGNLQEQFSGGRPLIEQSAAAGDAVAGSVRQRARELKGASQAKYAEAEAGNVSLSTNALPSLRAAITNALGPDVLIARETTPTAFRVRAFIDRWASMPHVSGGKPVAVSLQGLDEVRKVLSKAKPVPGSQDATAIRDMREAFDTWLDDAVNDALFDGDPAALNALKEARGLWQQYRAITRPKKGDDAGALIAKMAEREVTPVEVTNWLLGSGELGASGRSVRLVNRVRQMFGDDSDELSSLRQAMWLKLNFGPEGAATARQQMPGPQLVARRLATFLNGKGGDLARALYTPDQLRAIADFAGVVRRLVPNPKATNPSKSGYVITRELANRWANAATLLGFVGSGMDLGFTLTVRGVFHALREGRGFSGARRATRRPVPTIAKAPTGRAPAMLSGPVSDEGRRRFAQ
jgi:hypothetical protein